MNSRKLQQIIKERIEEEKLVIKRLKEELEHRERILRILYKSLEMLGDEEK